MYEISEYQNFIIVQTGFDGMHTSMQLQLYNDIGIAKE